MYRGRLEPHTLRILLQYLVAFKNYNYLNLNVHFFKVNKSLNCYSDIGKEEWPPNSPDLNPLDYHVWGAMLGCYQKYTPKSSNIAELKTALLSIWNDLPQEFIDKAILSFRERLRSCVAAAGGHFEHSV